MRKLREIGLVVVLTITLSGPALAGIIGTVPEAPPAPPEPDSTTSSVAASLVVALVQSVVR